MVLFLCINGKQFLIPFFYIAQKYTKYLEIRQKQKRKIINFHNENKENIEGKDRP